MSDAGQITIALGRFEDLVARGLRGLVEDDPGLSLVASDVTSAQLEATLAGLRPQVAILDAAALTRPSDLRGLSAAHPQTHIVLLAERPSHVEIAQLVAFGATACLSRATQERDVLNAIHLASRGLRLTQPDPGAHLDGSGMLTARETDVLAQLQQRRSNAQIAADLHVSIETVRTHARHIYRKLGVRSRHELLAVAHPQQRLQGRRGRR